MRNRRLLLIAFAFSENVFYTTHNISQLKVIFDSASAILKSDFRLRKRSENVTIGFGDTEHHKLTCYLQDIKVFYLRMVLIFACVYILSGAILKKAFPVIGLLRYLSNSFQRP